MSKSGRNLALTLLGKTPGIRKIKTLSEEERRSLLEADSLTEETMIGGRAHASCFNEGLQEALSRKRVVVCSTDMSFKWPMGPHVILKEGEVIVGFISDNVDQIKQKYGENICVFGKNMMMFPDRVRSLRGEKRTPTLFVYKGFNLIELESEPKLKNGVLAFCTRTGDAYLKELLKEKEKRGIGSIVIGFDTE